MTGDRKMTLRLTGIFGNRVRKWEEAEESCAARGCVQRADFQHRAYGRDEKELTVPPDDRDASKGKLLY